MIPKICNIYISKRIIEHTVGYLFWFYFSEDVRVYKTRIFGNLREIFHVKNCQFHSSSLEEGKSFLLFQCEAFIYTGKFLLEHPGYRKEEQMCKQTLKSSDALIGVGYEIFTNRCG